MGQDRRHQSDQRLSPHPLSGAVAQGQRGGPGDLPDIRGGGAGHGVLGTYAATKAGLEALVRCWADEVETTTAIRAVLLDPGAMRTKMRAEAYPGEDKDALTDPSEIGPMIVQLALAQDLGLPTKTTRFTDWRSARQQAPLR